MSNHNLCGKGILLKASGCASKIDIFAISSVIIPFCLYLLTLAPSVTFFDSGEFITAIHSLGSPHSPGYPLFVLFAKPFTWLPFGNIAFRVNIATALSAACACYGVYLLVTFMVNGNRQGSEQEGLSFIARPAALGASLTFAFSSRLWLQSNHDKPYPLLAFLAAIIFYLLLVWRKKFVHGEECPGYIYLGAFLCGLAFGAHQSMVLLVPSYAWLVLSADWRMIRRIKEQILAGTFFVLGFSVYLYLPIRASRGPLLNWGDPQTLTQFSWHFLRKGYPSEKVHRDMALLWKQLSAFNIVHEFTVVGLALLVTGLLAYLFVRRDEVIAFLIGVFVFLAVLAVHQNTPEEMIFLTEEFFTPLYLLSAVFIGLGTSFLLKKAVQGIKLSGIRAVFVHLASGVIIFALPAALCAMHFHENDQHENYIAYDYANNTFRSLAPGSVLFTWGDSGAFPLWYLQGVERMREDLVLIHTPHLAFEWYLDSFPGVFGRSALRTVPPQYQSPSNLVHLAVAEQISARPVYVDFSTRYSVKLEGYGLRQSGICYRVENGAGKAKLPPGLEVWNFYSLRGLVGDSIPFRDIDTSKAILIYAISRLEAGETLLSFGRRDEGYAELKKAVQLAPGLATQVRQIEREYAK